MPRADGPVMPSPRAGMAMMRESSSQTTARARIDIPLPDAQILGALLETREIVRLDALAVGGLAFDRDQLVVDEAAQAGLEDSQFFRQFEIHFVLLPGRPPATPRARQLRPR